MIKDNCPIVLRGLELSGSVIAVDFDFYKENHCVPLQASYDLNYLDLDSENEALTAAFARLAPFVGFLINKIPDFIALEYIQENYNTHGFKYLKKVGADIANNENQRFFRRAKYSDFFEVCNTIYLKSIKLDDMQKSVIFNAKTYIGGEAVTLKLPKLNIDHAAAEKKTIGKFYFEAVRYEIYLIQEILIRLVTDDIQERNTQLELFAKRKYTSPMLEAKGDTASDNDMAAALADMVEGVNNGQVSIRTS